MKRALISLFAGLLFTLPVFGQAAPKNLPGNAPALSGKVLDINTATPGQLEALPGIGTAYSKKIIDGRPYARKDDLVSKAILTQGVYDKVKDLIVARQATKGK